MPEVFDITEIDSNNFNRINVEVHTKLNELDKCVHGFIENWMNNDQEHVFVKSIELPGIRGMNNIHGRAIYLCTADIYIESGSHPTQNSPIHCDVWYTKCGDHENGSIVLTNINSDKVIVTVVFNQSLLPDPYKSMMLKPYFDMLLKCV